MRDEAPFAQAWTCAGGFYSFQAHDRPGQVQVVLRRTVAPTKSRA